jgi:osmotically-inducible protein OsmY
MGGASDPINSYLPRDNQDKNITQAVITALFMDPDLNQNDFTVTTTDGIVHIAGETRSASLRQRVIDIVRDIDGVKDVDATIAVQ